MIDMQTEQLITLSEASRLIPGRPSTTTLWRWRIKGVRGRVLESVTVGGKTYTSREAIERFAEQGGSACPSSTVRSPAARERAIAQAERELREAGI